MDKKPITLIIDTKFPKRPSAQHRQQMDTLYKQIAKVGWIGMAAVVAGMPGLRRVVETAVENEVQKAREAAVRGMVDTGELRPSVRPSEAVEMIIKDAKTPIYAKRALTGMRKGRK